LIVIDASAAVDLSLGRESRAEWLAQRLDRERAIQVPAVFDIEVLHSLRRIDSLGRVGSSAIEDALSDLVEIRAVRHDHGPLLPRIWALRHNLSAYDAAYVALAEALDAPLLTTDRRLARTSGHAAAIESPPT
jgi:predicted nucleic acid-binding protein